MVKTATKATARKAETRPAGKPATSTAQRAAQPARPASQATKAPEEPRKTHGAITDRLPATRTQAPPPAEMVNQLPAHMRSDVDMGKENIGQADMDMPRLKLMQGLSKELQLYDDLRPGHFFHTASEMIFDEAFRVVPIYFDRQYILWRPLEDGGGILARAADGQHWSPSSGEFTVKLDRKDGGDQVTWKLKPTVQESGLANWGTMNPKNNNSPPAATLMYNFLLAFPDYPDLMPAVLTFQRSSIKIGRKFMTKLKTVRTPLFGSVFTLSSIDDHNSANQDYKNISMVGAGLVEDEALYDMYKSLHLSLSKSGLNIRDVDSLQDDPEAAPAGDDPNAPAY
jgi:hypothetical protein